VATVDMIGIYMITYLLCHCKVGGIPSNFDNSKVEGVTCPSFSYSPDKENLDVCCISKK